VILSQCRQVNFSRTLWMTFHWRGTTSLKWPLSAQEQKFRREIASFRFAPITVVPANVI
jgi:hypothetical protein